MILRRIRIALFIFVISGWVSTLKAQEDDFNLWASMNLETHLNKRLSMVIELSDRWHENAGIRDITFMEAGLDYSKKWLSAGVSYRFENKADEDVGYMLGHRLIAFVEGETGTGRFSFSLRNKFQADYVAVRSSENGRMPASYDRTRVKVDYNIRKIPLKPYLSYEIFSKVNMNDMNMIAKKRIGSGFSYKLNSKNKLGISFYREREANVVRPDTDYILSILYILELN